MRLWISAVLVWLNPQVTAAEEWTCRFSAVCAVGAACLDTERQIHVFPSDQPNGAILAQGPDLTLVTQLPGEAISYAAPFLLLTIAPSGNASLTEHRRATQSFLGSCDNTP